VVAVGGSKRELPTLIQQLRKPKTIQTAKSTIRDGSDVFEQPAPRKTSQEV
jgi:hypothetical protein